MNRSDFFPGLTPGLTSVVCLCEAMRPLLWVFVCLCCLGLVRTFCPSQCTCVHGHSDGTGTRSVLCNDPDMSDIPVNVPVDTVKLRIEKTGVRRIPTEAFYYLMELRYLWITYNSVATVDAGSFYNLKVLHELRLDGNMITTFPWESLKEMPRLRTLDLHNNRLTSVPVEAVPYLLNITYLDLSSNKLTTLPSDLMDIWPPFNGVIATPNASQKVVLGLQDNPWFCDCRISKLMELSKMPDTPVVLMDLFLSCSGPEHLSGVLFQKAELAQCVKPTVMASATKITSSLGSNVVVRCDVTGHPTPTLIWAKSDGSLISNAVQESPGDGVRWSIMSLHGIMHKDAGNYSCKAKNFAGNAVATISVSVVGSVSTATPTLIPETSTGSRALPTTPVSPNGMSSSATIQYTVTPKPGTTTLSSLPMKTKPTPSNVPQKGSLKPARIQQGGTGGNLAADEKSNRKDPSTSVKDITVVEVTSDSVVLLWTSEGLPSDTPLTVVYSPYGEDYAKRTLETRAGSGKVLLEGLLSRLKYSVCLVAKASVAGKDPCVDFYTLGVVDDGGHSPLLMIVSGVACAVAVPLIALLLYKILALYCKGKNAPLDEEELGKESYVKFETISMKQRASKPGPPELWPRRQTRDSERMLLCSRSSIDSQITYNSDNCRSEYLC